jgi:uncharacterized phage protein (TIGR01671 family)
VFSLSNQFILTLDFDNITLLEYTGLKDKNGKEIYESDIVRLYAKGTEHLFDEDTHVVEWISESEGGFSIGWGLFNNTFDYEVIGNVFENPELLETSETSDYDKWRIENA